MLLFDANLSPKLAGRLGELFPGSMHVFQTGLASYTSDETIWQYAKRDRICSGNRGFWLIELATQLGAPPKVVRLENCNYPTSQAELALRRYAIAIADLEHSERSVLILRKED